MRGSGPRMTPRKTLSCPGPASARYTDGARRLRASAEPGPRGPPRHVENKYIALRASCAGSRVSLRFVLLARDTRLCFAAPSRVPAQRALRYADRPAAARERRAGTQGPRRHVAAAPRHPSVEIPARAFGFV